MKIKSIFSSIFIIALIIVGGFFLWKNQGGDSLFKIISPKENKVCLEDNCFDVELAKTREEQSKGLMFRDNLDSDKGMLFIFDKEDIYPFWMKNTLISLDIIWINQNNEVVFTKENAQPCSEDNCEIISPDKKAKYVLELNSGKASEINLKIGDRLVLHLY